MTSTEKEATNRQGADGRLRMDWREVADDRLGHLVDLEHDHAVMRDRLLQLQVEYRELVGREDIYRERIHELDGELEHMERRLHTQADECRREYEAMQAVFTHSRSWRITRPLRELSSRCSWLGWHTRRAVRALLRIRMVRRIAGLALRPFPRLHQRLRQALYHHHYEG